MTAWQEWLDWRGYERCTECKRQETLNEYQLCEPCFKALGPWLDPYDVPEIERLTQTLPDPLKRRAA